MSDVLTIHDRCDACTAQALVRVYIDAGALDFCGHHYALHGGRMMQKGLAILRVIDERGKVNA